MHIHVHVGKERKKNWIKNDVEVKRVLSILEKEWIEKSFTQVSVCRLYFLCHVIFYFFTELDFYESRMDSFLRK